MTLESTHPVTEMSTRNISLGGKGGQCVGLTNLPPSCANCLEVWEPQPLGTVRACTGITLSLALAFRSMRAVANMAVFCSSLISCFPGILLFSE